MEPLSGLQFSIEKDPPEELLARLLYRRLNVTVDPLALRAFVREHWSRLTVLAHRIHGDPA